MCGLVPGLPPVPWQSGQGASEVSRRLIVTPSIASVKPIVAVVSTSAPRTRRARWVLRRRAAAAEEVAEHVAEAAASAAAVAQQVVDVEAAGAAAGAAEAAAEAAEPPPAVAARISSYFLRFSASPTTS